MSSSKHVILQETTNNVWNLIGPKGHIIVEGVRLYSKAEAEQWVKCYVSSWNDWKYEVKELK